jgi:hypothetical protein
VDAEASTSTPGAGEIDVSFTLDGRRYILEAKWEQTKTNVDPLAKLSLRLDQRMAGTIGVFISMAGYTPDAASPNHAASGWGCPVIAASALATACRSALM